MKLMIWIVFATACTTLGPMPATTGISAVPIGRPGVEAQAGIMPGYLLSRGTEAPDVEDRGDPSAQLLALVEPDRWLGTHDLIVGARNWGREGDRATEPFIGLRHRLDENFSLAAIGYGTVMRGAEGSASYRATRIGGELAIDARILRLASWLAVHGQAAVSTTYLDAKGRYCVDPQGYGEDCDNSASDHLIDGTVHGAFPAATGSVSIDLGRLPTGVFHSARLALLGAVGVMPQVRNGVETERTRYTSAGLSLTLGFGNAR